MPNNYDLYKRITPILDVATELRTIGTAAATITGVNAGVSAPEVTKGFNNTVIINSLGYTGYAAGTVFWSVSVQASADNSNFFDVTPTIILTGTAQTRVLGIHSASVAEIVPGATHYRIRHILTGAAGPLTYGAFITKGVQ
jgi:hypothetical protein